MIAVPDALKGRDFTRVADFSSAELDVVLDLAERMKAAAREEQRVLPGRSLGMIFQKPSTRTRVSCEVGIAQLGRYGLYMRAPHSYLCSIRRRGAGRACGDPGDQRAHRRDPPVPGARRHAVRERLGRLEGVRVVYLGDGNNVCSSLMVAAARLGSIFVAATPAGYEPDERASRPFGTRRRTGSMPRRRSWHS